MEGKKCKIRAFHTETISAFSIVISSYILVSNLVPISRTLQGIRQRFNQMYSVLIHSSTTPGQGKDVQNVQDLAPNG